MTDKPESRRLSDRLRKFEARPRKARVTKNEKESIPSKLPKFSEGERAWLLEFETTVQAIIDTLRSEHANMVLLSKEDIHEKIVTKENQADKLIRLLQQAADHKYPLNDDLNQIIANRITDLGESAKENMNNLRTVSDGVRRVADCLDRAIERVSGDGTYERSGLRTRNTADRPARIDEGI